MLAIFFLTAVYYFWDSHFQVGAPHTFEGPELTIHVLAKCAHQSFVNFMPFSHSEWLFYEDLGPPLPAL